MRHDRSIELLNRLRAEFDDKTVELVMEELGSTPFYNLYIPTLLKGRGAASLLPRIKQALAQYASAEPSLRSISKASRWIPEQETEALLEKLDVTDSDLIEEIGKGRFPHLSLLPEVRRNEIFSELRNRLYEGTYVESGACIAQFLLDFDRDGETVSSSSLTAVEDWCIRLAEDERVQHVLGLLLRYRRSPVLLNIAESHLKKLNFDALQSMLLSNYIDLAEGRDPRWLQVLFRQADPCDLFGTEVASYVKATNCSRRSLKIAKRAIAAGCPGWFMIVETLFGFLHKRTVSREMYRSLRTNIDDPMVQGMVRRLLLYKPSKKHRELALRAMLVADGNTELELLKLLIFKTDEPEVTNRAKRRVESYPNAPDSFILMRGLARIEPEFAVPWLLEWIPTALPEQCCEAWVTIVNCSSDDEHVQAAKRWLTEIDRNKIEVQGDGVGYLLFSLLKKSPSNDVIKRASRFLNSTSTVSVSGHRRLSRLLDGLGETELP